MACSLWLAGPVSAQSTYGAVVGVVTDNTGAVVPGATVTLTEVQTAVARAGVSKENGTYEFLNLTQGLYRVEVELAGFRKFESASFRVEARETKRINAGLAIGGLSEQVVVQSVAPIINTETPTRRRTASCRSCRLPSARRTPRRSWRSR